MTVYIYAETVVGARKWMREVGLRARECEVFSHRSSCVGGTTYRGTDRIIFLGQVNWKLELIVAHEMRNSPEPRPEIERVTPCSSADRAAAS